MKQWVKSLASGLEELLVGFILTVCGYALLLSFFKMLWELYCETQVCKKFQGINISLFETINAVMHESLVIFPAPAACWPLNYALP